jgi:hypothetical protein
VLVSSVLVSSVLIDGSFGADVIIGSFGTGR